MAAPTAGTPVTGTTSPLSVTITSGQALVVCVGTHQGTISNVQYNGVAGTLIAAGDTAFHERFEIYYWASPSVGTFNVTFSAGGSGDGCCAIPISGQKTTGQPRSSTSNNNATTMSLANASDNALYIGGCYGEAGLTMDTGLGLTSDYLMQQASFENMAVAHAANDLGVQKFHWTQSSGQRNCMAAIAIEGTTSTDFPIQIDASTNVGESATVSSKTVSHTTGTLTNGIIVALVGLRGGTVGNLTVTGVTYGGVALTKLRSDLYNTTTFVREEIWYLVAPASGANNLVVTATGTCDFINVIIETFSGVDQSTPFDVNAGTGTITANATSVTTNITPTVNNNFILDNIWSKDDVSFTQNSGVAYFPTSTAAMPEHVGTDYHAASFKRQATAAATSMGYSWTNADGYAHGVGVLKPAATTSIKKVSSVAYASIKKISGVPIASVKKVAGLA